MSYPVFKLDPKGPAPYVEIRVFYTLIGGYRLFRWQQGAPTAIGDGVTNDARPDLFPLGVGPVLSERTTLSIELLITKTPGTDYPSDGVYLAEVHVLQNDSPAQGSPLPLTGNLTEGEAARLQYIELENL